MGAPLQHISAFMKRLPLRAVKYSVFASAARTATPTAYEIEVDGHKGVEVLVDLTTAGSPSVVPLIESWDEITGAYVTLLTGAAIVVTGAPRLTIYPGATAAANVTANGNIRNKLRISMTHGNGVSATYSVNLCLLP